MTQESELPCVTSLKGRARQACAHNVSCSATSSTHASIPALVHDLIEDASDTYECAIRDLTGIGLLHCSGGIVAPTVAALRFDCISST